MNKKTRRLMLTTALASGIFFSGWPAWAQQSPPYCQLLRLPKPEKAAPPAQTKPTPGTSLPSPGINSPPPGTAPGTISPAASPPAVSAPAGGDGKETPADAKNTKPVVPNIVDLVKLTTNAKDIVSQILDAAAAKKPQEFDAMYAQMYDEIVRIYIEPSDLIKVGLPAYKTKFDGKMKTWGDYTDALRELFKQVGNRWTYIHDPSEILAQQIGGSQKLVDFGASLHLRDDGQFEIEFLEPGTTAQTNGFREGDLITSVNGTALKGLSKNDAEKLLSKADGDQLKIASLQDGNPVEGLYTLRAAPDDANNDKAELIDNKFAYVKLPSFTDEDTFAKLLEELLGMEMTSPAGLQGIILDLRYNGGGIVNLAKLLIQTLQQEGVVLHEKKRDPEDPSGRRLIDETTSIMPEPAIMKVGENPAQLVALDEIKKVPLVILINGSSASASEIVTGSLHEARPHTIVMGKRSFGKFVEMSMMSTPNCGQAAIMSAMYTTPKGNWWQGLGITPDIEVDQPRNSKDDVQLARAVQWLVDNTAHNGANLATMAPNDMQKILGKVVDKPLEPKISNLSQWLEANTATLKLGGVALLLLLVGLVMWFVTRPPKQQADD